MHQTGRGIGLLLLALMVPAAIFGLNAIVLPAEYGLSSVFYYLMAGILFFVPAAYVAARFGIRFPGEEGGVYLWVSESFGPKYGLWVTWLQWIQQVIWYPTILSYMASTFAFVFFPAESGSSLFIALFCVVMFLVLTCVTILGVELSAKLTAFAFAIGVLLPGVIFIVLAFTWYFSSSSLALFHFSWAGLLPDHNAFKNIGIIGGVVTGFTGIEVCAAYAHRVINPKKTYPRAIVLAAIITITIFILGTLSVLMVLSPAKMDFTAAIIQAIHLCLAHFHLEWLNKPLGVCIVLGSFAIVLVWILAPMLSFYASAKHHDLPAWFRQRNKRGVPVNLLVIQALIVCLFSFTFYFSQTVNDAFWLLTVLSGQIYFLMYFFVFLAALKLKRGPFLWVCLIFGMIACFISIFSPFDVPKSILETMSVADYEMYLIIGLLLVCVIIPFLWGFLNRRFRG